MSVAKDYVDAFRQEDRDRLFRFLALFARWECSLKRTGFLKPADKRKGSPAEADWNGYADAIAVTVAGLAGAEWTRARGYLLSHPPKRQVVQGGAVCWADNPRRPSESDVRYLFRIVKDVRNNVFHGGKYPNPNGPVAELARDRLLVDAATVVLESCAELDDRVTRLFLEAA